MSQNKAQLIAPVGIFTASGINATGVVTASSFVGDGSQLQGVGVGTAGSINSSGIITAASFYGSGIGLTGITLLGPTNSLNTSGIITAGSFYGDGAGITNIGGPLDAISYSPAIGATGVGATTNIVITFNKPIAGSAATAGIASVTLRTGSASGTIVETFDVATSTALSISGGVLTINPTENLSGLTTYFVVAPAGTFQDTLDTSDNVGITTYSFITTEQLNYVTGELYSFGYNGSGSLGLNDKVQRSSPTQIPGTQWTSLVGHGYPNNHAIKSDKTLWGIGQNAYGELGLNNVIPRSSPTQIPGTQWGTVGNSYLGGLATKIDGTLWAWGANALGQLGQNDRVNRSSPIQIPGTQWVYNNPDLFGGGGYIHYCGHCVKTDGTLWVWGYNQYGELGQNNKVSYSSPVQLPGTQWSNILLSGTCGGVKTDGTLWTWGVATFGAIGNNATTYYSSPVQIPGTQWSYFSGGTYYSCGATKTDGTLWMWGFNNAGQIGDGTSTYRSSPRQIPGTQWNISRYGLSIGFYGTYALKTDGTLWAWGQGVYGQLGQNNTTYRSSPIQIPGTQWIAVPRQGGKVYSGFALKSAP